MFDIFPIIILIVEIIMITSFILFAVKNKVVVSKKTIWYFLPLSLTMMLLYWIGFNYNINQVGGSIGIFDYVEIIQVTLKTTGFSIERDFIENLVNDNIVYTIAFFLNFVAIVFTVYSSILGLFINKIKNKYRVCKALLNDCDVLIGDNHYNDLYLKSYENCLILLEEDNKEVFNKFYSLGIPFIRCKFKSDRIINYFKRSLDLGKTINFLSFNNSDLNLEYINEFKQLLSLDYKDKKISEYQKFFLKVEINLENQTTIKNQILKDKQFAAYIDCINHHDLLALDYIEKYPITKDLPNSFFDYDTATIKSDYKINVFYLGFGESLKTIHRVNLMNNQLVTIENKKIKQFNINYYAFDNLDTVKADKNMLYYMHRYDNNIKKYESNLYFDSCDKLDNIILENKNVNSADFLEEFINDLDLDNKKSFNRIFISLGSDIDNVDYALKINMFLQENNYENYKIFVRITKKNKNIESLLCDSKIIIFGFESKVFSHDVIVNERLLSLAKLLNKKYNTNRLYESSWFDLPVIKQSSNIYSSLNVRLKLNLLGFDYIKRDDIVDNADALEKLSDKLYLERQGYEDYYFYKNNNYHPSHCLAYQEHQRWNAFYLANGYVPMAKDEIRLIDEKNASFYKDDNILMMHACITTFMGLDQYHRHLAGLLSQKNNKSVEENLELVETYKYDYLLIEEFSKLFVNTHYKLIDLNNK